MSESVDRGAQAGRQFETDEGRRPRILVAKIGRTATIAARKVIARLRDLGFDVDIGPLFAPPAKAARQAIENDVTSSASPRRRRPSDAGAELKAPSRAKAATTSYPWSAGVVPPQDYEALKVAGAEAIFSARHRDRRAAEELVRKLQPRLGHDAPRPSRHWMSVLRPDQDPRCHRPADRGIRSARIAARRSLPNLKARSSGSALRRLLHPVVDLAFGPVLP